MHKKTVDLKTLVLSFVLISVIFFLFSTKLSFSLVDACCRYSTSCVSSGGGCFNTGECYGSDVMKNSFCDNTYWKDPDQNQNFCKQSCDLTKNDDGIAYVKSGEDSSFGDYASLGQIGCCGDDNNEYYTIFNLDENIKACCNKPTDCITKDGKCVPDGTNYYYDGTPWMYYCAKSNWVAHPCNRDLTCNVIKDDTTNINYQCMGNEEVGFYWNTTQKQYKETDFGGIFGCIDYLDTDCDKSTYDFEDDDCYIFATYQKKNDLITANGGYLFNYKTATMTEFGGVNQDWDREIDELFYPEGWYPDIFNNCTWNDFNADNLKECNLFYYFKNKFGLSINVYDFTACNDKVDNDRNGCNDEIIESSNDLVKFIEASQKDLTYPVLGLSVGDYKCGANELGYAAKYDKQIMFDGIDNDCNGRIDFGWTPDVDQYAWMDENHELKSPFLNELYHEEFSKIKVHSFIYDTAENPIKDAEIVFWILTEYDDFEGRSESIPRDYFKTTTNQNGYYEININKGFNYSVQVYVNKSTGQADIIKPLAANYIPIGESNNELEFNIYLITSEEAENCNSDCTLNEGNTCDFRCQGVNGCNMNPSCDGKERGYSYSEGDIIYTCCSGSSLNTESTTINVESATLDFTLMRDIIKTVEKRTVLYGMPSKLKIVVMK